MDGLKYIVTPTEHVYKTLEGTNQEQEWRVCTWELRNTRTGTLVAHGKTRVRLNLPKERSQLFDSLHYWTIGEW